MSHAVGHRPTLESVGGGHWRLAATADHMQNIIAPKVPKVSSHYSIRISSRLVSGTVELLKCNFFSVSSTNPSQPALLESHLPPALCHHQSTVLGQTWGTKLRYLLLGRKAMTDLDSVLKETSLCQQRSV